MKFNEFKDLVLNDDWFYLKETMLKNKDNPKFNTKEATEMFLRLELTQQFLTEIIKLDNANDCLFLLRILKTKFPDKFNDYFLKNKDWEKAFNDNYKKEEI